MEFRLIDGTRPVRVTRTLPVEELSPLECKKLLYHCCEENAVPGRRKALWEKWFNWFKGQALQGQPPEGDTR